MSEFNINLLNLNSFLDRLRALPDAVNTAVNQKSQALATELVQSVQDDKLSGQVLEARTGTLKGSIESAVENTGSGVNASVFVADDVPYAVIQEYGGITRAHVIAAVNAKTLAFNFAGKQQFFPQVQHPGSVIPERSYLRSALEDTQDDITAGMADALASVL